MEDRLERSARAQRCQEALGRDVVHTEAGKVHGRLVAVDGEDQFLSDSADSGSSRPDDGLGWVRRAASASQDEDELAHVISDVAGSGTDKRVEGCTRPLWLSEVFFVLLHLLGMAFERVGERNGDVSGEPGLRTVDRDDLVKTLAGNCSYRTGTRLPRSGDVVPPPT